MERIFQVLDQPMSTRIEALVGVQADFLCHYLDWLMSDCVRYSREFRALADTQAAIQSFVRSVSRYSALASFAQQILRADGQETPEEMAQWRMEDAPIDVDSPAWRELRDKWCMDYAQFLREFGF